MVGGFDSFSDNAHAQGVRQSDNASHHVTGLLIGGQRRDETAVDLEFVNRQAAQPIALNTLRPAVIEAAPPGTVVEGVGGARNCMKTANSVTSLELLEASVPSEWEMSSG